jgi:hypothetical protein
MKFEQALEGMKQGAKVKLPHWAGYWQLEDGNIKMHCKDGKVIDLKESEDILFTLGNILSDDWVFAEVSYLSPENLIQTLTFGEALRKLKNGYKVARKGWNGKGMWLVLVKAEDYALSESFGTRELLPFIAMKTADNKLVPWLASQTDILAEDWMVVE